MSNLFDSVSIEPVEESVEQNPIVPPSVSEFKSNLLASISPNKAANLFTNLDAPRSTDVLPDPLTVLEKKVALVHQRGQLKRAQRIKREETALISDQGADTFLGGAANIALKGVGGVAQVGGETLTLGSSVMNALDMRGITDNDIALYESINKKGNRNLTPEETEFTKAIGGIRESKFDRLKHVDQRQQFINKIDADVEAVKKLSNSKKEGIALTKVKANSAEAIQDFSDGKVVDGMAKFINGFTTLAADDTAAAVELTAQSLPQMYVLAKNALLGVSTLSVAGYDDAVREFVAEHGRQPNQQEKAIAGSLALVSAGLDAVGAKAVINGKELVKSVLGYSEKIGLKTAKATVKAAEEATKAGSTSLLKKSLGITKSVATSRPVRAVPVEGSTEGAQNILSQLAAKQDLSKVDLVEALVDTTIGGVSGAHISSAIVTGEAAIVKLPQKLQKEARKLNEKLTEAGIGETRTVLAQAVKNKDVDTAIKAVAQDFGSRPEEERVSQLATLEKLIETTKDPKEKAKHTESLVQLSQAHNRLVSTGSTKNGSVTNAINVLNAPATEKRATPEVKAAAVKLVVNNVGTTSDVTLELVNKALGSAPFDPKSGIASKEDIATLTSYRNLLQKTEIVENTAESDIGKGTAAVNKEVIEGSKKTGFIGIRQHLKNFQVAIAQSNRDGAVTVLKKLKEFREAQAIKLERGYLPATEKQLYDQNGEKIFTNYREHSSNPKNDVKGFITQEIAALDAAIEFAEAEGIKRFGLKKKDIPTLEPEIIEKQIIEEPVVEKKEEKKVEVVQTKEEAAELAKDVIDKATARQEPVTPEVTEPTEAPGHINLLDPEYKDMISDLSDVTIPKEIDVEGVVHILQAKLSRELKRIDKRINGLAFVFKECG